MPDRPPPLQLTRIGIGLALLWDALIRWPDVFELFSTSGTTVSLFAGTPWCPPTPSPWGALLLHSIWVSSSVLLVLGWKTQTSAALCMIPTIWLPLLDMPTTLTKYGIIEVHVLFWLAIAGDRSSVSQRMIQVLVCAVYLGAAVTKLTTPDYLSGNLIAFSLRSDLWGRGTWSEGMADQIELLRLFSFGSLLFELLFPFLVWVPRARLPILGMAFLFHASLSVVLYLGTFTFVMWSVLACFLEPSDWDWLRRRRGLLDQKQINQTSPKEQSWFKVLAIHSLSLLIGIAWHRPYADPTPKDWRPALVLLPPQSAIPMIIHQQPAESLFLYHVKLGNRRLNSRVFGGKQAYSIGETVYAEVRLLQPHPVGLMEFVWTGVEGTEIARYEAEVETSTNGVVGGLELTEGLPPGDYRLLIRFRSYDCADIRFQVRE